MDPVERRRTQNRMAQRRFRSKKASESNKKPSLGTASSTTKDSVGSTTFITYSSTDGANQTHSSATTTALSHNPKVVTKNTEKSVPSASTDLLNSLPENVQNILLPESRDDFSAANPSLADFVSQGTDQSMSMSLPPPSSLSNKPQDPLQLKPETDMHANLHFTNSPDTAFYGQPSGTDPGLNFSLAADQLTPTSLHDSSETGSITVNATGYQIGFCQDCSALRICSPSHASMRDVSRQALVIPNGGKENILNDRGDGDNYINRLPDDSFESSLHIAAESGHGDLVDMLLRSGSIVDDSDSEGNTALHRAVDKRKLQVVQRLLCHGADPNFMNAAGRTPVHLAVSTGSMEIVETLVRFGGDLNRRARRKTSRVDANHGDSVEA